ncbi:TetR family transcriptional regulator [Mycolicibacterium conceptionense]|uniref:TetR family transcriptional regulator n=1 Tax=Mycolicibacterium conceptionense TaxID=451644 RepID=A0A0U1DHS6_9MYCO|nr:TetR/AcrR family transcriptional regulator [Mycolicibacterium conceptionense]ORV24665.1 hypothetical protein AWB98_20735 [Mycolicibacterium conceptionense]CQD16710.1 TetR family transcriptional regulator [Mycolicibacterium conceptionense]
MSPRSPGRPRSESVRLAVIGSTIELLTETGYGALTMQGIAQRAGVSKQTLYRWWSSPAEILLEALNEGAGQIAPLEESGDFETDLRNFAHRSVLGARGPVATLLRVVMAEAQRDEAFGESFREGFLARRRGTMRELLQRGVERGSVTGDVDIDLVVELFYGALWYRLLADCGQIDEEFAAQLANVLVRQLRT